MLMVVSEEERILCTKSEMYTPIFSDSTDMGIKIEIIPEMRTLIILLQHGKVPKQIKMSPFYLRLQI